MENKTDLARHIGERLREIRKGQGLNLKQLAEATGLSSSFLSRVEHGSTVPSILTLQTIADRLKVDVGYIFKSDERENFTLSRNGAREVKHAERGTKGKVTYEVEFLAEGFENPYMEPVIATIVRRDHKGFEAIRHGGQELLYVLEGKIEMTLGSKTVIMHKGDSVYYDGDLAHKAISLSKKPAQTLNVHFIPGRRVGSLEILT